MSNQRESAGVMWVGANKKRGAFVLTLLAAAYLWLAPFARLYGQSPADSTAPDRLLTPQTQDNPPKYPEPATPGTPAAIGDRCSPNYWIISTRGCSQDAQSCSPYCCFDYVHRTPDGCLCRSDNQTFRESLVPGVPICLMIHGSFVSWDDVREEGEKTFAWLRNAAPQLPLHVVFFTWPSEGAITGIPSIDVGLLGRRSAWNGVYLAQLVLQLEPGSPICLIGHSHGARTTLAAIHLLGGGAVQGTVLYGASPAQRRIRVALAAAAVDHDWLNPGQLYGNALCSVECLLNMRNRYDVPLFFYPLRQPFSKRALARSGFTSGDYRQQGWLGAKTAELDVTHLVQDGHMWPNYYRHPEIACALVPWVYFNDGQLETQELPELPEVAPR